MGAILRPATLADLETLVSHRCDMFRDMAYGDEAGLSQALADLDALATEAGGEARLLPVLLEGGATYTAWVWAFPVEQLPRLEKEALEVPGGDWAAWL